MTLPIVIWLSGSMVERDMYGSTSAATRRDRASANPHSDTQSFGHVMFPSPFSVDSGLGQCGSIRFIHVPPSTAVWRRFNSTISKFTQNLLLLHMKHTRRDPTIQYRKESIGTVSVRAPLLSLVKALRVGRQCHYHIRNA